MTLITLIFFFCAELAVVLFVCQLGLQVHHGWIKKVMPVLIFAVLYRAILFLILGMVLGPDVQPDSERYDWGALHFSQGLQDGYFASIQEMIDTVGTQNGVFYMYLVGIIYFITGADSSVAVNLNNCLVGSLILVPLYALAYGVSGNKTTAKTALWIYAFLPTAAYWSVLSLKESFDALLYVAAIAMFVFPRNRMAYPVGIALLFVLYFERSYVAYLVLLSLAVSWWSLNSSKQMRWLILFLAVATMVGIYSTSQQGLDQITVLIEIRNELFNDGSVLSGIKSAIPIYAVWILDMLHLALTPLPISPPSGWDSFLGIAILFWYLLIPYTVIGFARLYALRTLAARSVVIFAIAGFTLYAFTYAGSHYRGRDSLLPLAAIAAAFALSRRAKNACVPRHSQANYHKKIPAPSC